GDLVPVAPLLQSVAAARWQHRPGGGVLHSQPSGGEEPVHGEQAVQGPRRGSAGRGGRPSGPPTVPGSMSLQAAIAITAAPISAGASAPLSGRKLHGSSRATGQSAKPPDGGLDHGLHDDHQRSLPYAGRRS